MVSPRRPPVQAEALRFRLAVLLEEGAALRQMAVSMRIVIAGLDEQIMAVSQRIAAQAAAGRVAPGAVVELAEYVRFREQATQALMRYTGGVSRQIETLQLNRIEQALEHTRALTESALPRGLTFEVLARTGITWATLEPSAFEYLAGRMRDGGSLRAYLEDRIVSGTIEDVERELTRGLLRNPNETARVLRRTFAGGLSQAVRVARTETLRVYRDVQRESYSRNSRVVKGYRRVASLDDRTCVACWLMDGVLYESAGDMEEHVQGRCFTVPETVSWKDLGLEGVPEVEPEESGRSRFERLPDAEQRRIIGNGRQFEAWKSGEIPTSALLARHSHPTFGSQIVQATAGQSLSGRGLARLPGPAERIASGAALLHPPR